MSIFDSEIKQFDKVDEAVAGKSLGVIMDFIVGCMPTDIYRHSFTDHNKEEIKKYTFYNINQPFYPQHTYYVEIGMHFYKIPTRDGSTYSYEGNTRCARIELVRKGTQYYICPNFIKWPIIISDCALNKLPKSIRFAKKNPKSKSPLTFIIRYNDYPKWIKDLPKGSIVYLIPDSYMTIEHMRKRDGCDFTKFPDFEYFVKAYGEKIIID